MIQNCNGKTTKIPYSVDEDKFEFLVAEIGGTKEEPTKYYGNFLFIPRKDLIELNFFRSSTSKGKSNFTICAPDYTGEHWSKKYWLPLIITNEQRNLFS